MPLMNLSFIEWVYASVIINSISEWESCDATRSAGDTWSSRSSPGSRRDSPLVEWSGARLAAHYTPSCRTEQARGLCVPTDWCYSTLDTTISCSLRVVTTSCRALVPAGLRLTRRRPFRLWYNNYIQCIMHAHTRTSSFYNIQLSCNKGVACHSNIHPLEWHQI